MHSLEEMHVLFALCARTSNRWHQPVFAETIRLTHISVELNTMRKPVLTAAAACLLASSLTFQLRATNKTAARPPALKVGDAAPDFKLQYFDGKDLKDVSLSEYRGKKNVVLAFYIFAFTGG
jgi:AhpC/TSA family